MVEGPLNKQPKVLNYYHIPYCVMLLLSSLMLIFDLVVQQNTVTAE